MGSDKAEWEVWDDAVFEAAAARNKAGHSWSNDKSCKGKSLQHLDEEIAILPPYEPSAPGSSSGAMSFNGAGLGHGFSEYSLVEKPPLSPQRTPNVSPGNITPLAETPAPLPDPVISSGNVISQIEVATPQPAPDTLPPDTEEHDDELPPFSPTGPSLDGPEYRETEGPPPSFPSESLPPLRDLSVRDVDQPSASQPRGARPPPSRTPARHAPTDSERRLPTAAQRLYDQSVSSVPSYRNMGPRPMPSAASGANRPPSSAVPRSSGRNSTPPVRPNPPMSSTMPMPNQDRQIYPMQYAQTLPTPSMQPPRPPHIINAPNFEQETIEAVVDPFSLYHSSVSSLVTSPVSASSKPRYSTNYSDNRSVRSSDSASLRSGSGSAPYNPRASFISTNTYSTSRSN